MLLFLYTSFFSLFLSSFKKIPQGTLAPTDRRESGSGTGVGPDCEVPPTCEIVGTGSRSGGVGVSGAQGKKKRYLFTFRGSLGHGRSGPLIGEIFFFVLG